MPKALIIGGGIGGTAAAIGLRRAGWEVQVFEQAPVFREVGAGLTIWSNATMALHYLGFDASLNGIGLQVDRIETRRSDGRLLAELSLADLGRPIQAASYAVHRASLLQLLVDALPPEVMHHSSTFVECTSHDGGVTARFADGRVEHGDILVGADGLRSTIRAALPGVQPLRYSGYTCWRGVAEGAGDLLSGAGAAAFGRETWGCGGRFGMLPIPGNKVNWYATRNVLADSPIPPGHAEILKQFGQWHAPIPDLIRLTPEAAILRHDVYDRAPMWPWGQGPVTVLGDAAHPMTPNLGQGACQAIEDAVVLAQCLKDVNTHAGAAGAEAGLRRYEHLRRGRTRRITLESRQVGSVGQWENSLVCLLRNTILRSMPTALVKRQIGRNVNYDVGRAVREG